MSSSAAKPISTTTKKPDKWRRDGKSSIRRRAAMMQKMPSKTLSIAQETSLATRTLREFEPIKTIG